MTVKAGIKLWIRPVTGITREEIITVKRTGCR